MTERELQQARAVVDVRCWVSGENEAEVMGAEKVGMSDRLLTAAEVAGQLSVPVSWVRGATRAGHLPHVELGRYRRYRWADVETYIEQQTCGGAGFRKHTPTIGGAR